MKWFVAKENLFEKYPDVSIVADSFEPVYVVRYTECVKERGTVRFERKEKKIAKESIESLIAEILSK
jgi:hypothetical protein